MVNLSIAILQIFENNLIVLLTRNEKYDNIRDIVDDKLQNFARDIANVLLPEDDRFQEVFVSNIRL